MFQPNNSICDLVSGVFQAQTGQDVLLFNTLGRKTEAQDDVKGFTSVVVGMDAENDCAEQLNWRGSSIGSSTKKATAFAAAF